MAFALFLLHSFISICCMTPYSLFVSFSAEDSADFQNRGLFVHVGKPAVPNSQRFPWITFDPFESNTVTWAEDYAVYASTQSMGSSANVFLPLSPLPAQKGRRYIYHDNGGLAERPGQVPDAIVVRNRLEEEVSLKVELKMNGWANGEDFRDQTVLETVLGKGQDWEYQPASVVDIWLAGPDGVPVGMTTLTFADGQFVGMVKFDRAAEVFNWG
jgi:hypothetical protein